MALGAQLAREEKKFLERERKNAAVCSSSRYSDKEHSLLSLLFLEREGKKKAAFSLLLEQGKQTTDCCCYAQ
jgi:hypothetical protein